MRISLVISVYKDVEALAAVLRTVLRQKLTDFEVIISQDGDSSCFDELIKEYGQKLQLKHLQQPDNGFLKNKILNQTIRVASSDKMVFIDGDCIIHPQFLKQYDRSIKEGRICMGRRIDLDPVTTKKIKENKAIYPSLFSMLKNKTTRIEEAMFLPWLPQKFHSTPKLIGCNMGWHKNDLIRLNGFDEDYQYPGFGEDTDIAWRAKKAGLEVFSVRYKAIEFHLDHARPDRENEVSKSELLFEQKKQRSDFRCLNGLEKLK
jgi:glycosyltransferase involved in cell wall biosynthesis